MEDDTTINQILNRLRYKVKWKNAVMVLIRLLCSLLTSYIAVQTTAEYYWFQARQLALFGEYDRAEAIYQKAYVALRSNSYFLYNYGAEACIAGRYDKALSLLQSARLNNSYSNLYFYLGESYFATGQISMAERQYQMTIRIAPRYLVPKERLVDLYVSRSQMKEAIQMAKSALEFPYRTQTETGDSIRAKLNRFIQSIESGNDSPK